MQHVDILVEPLGWTLLHFVWQGLLIGLLHEAALVVASRRTPQFRYAISLVALLAIIALPVITFALQAFGESSVPTGSFSARGSEIALTTSAVSTTEASLRHVLQAWLPYIVILWLAGVCLLSLRFGIGLYSLRRLAKYADYAAVSDWMNDELKRLSARMAITRPVRIALSTRVSSPLVVGWLKPVIFLPLSAATGLDHNQIRMVLAHELAHLRRHDHFVNFLQVVVETVLFYHPAVHRISRALREEREQCCDDMAAGISGNALAYARVLAQLEEMRQRERAHVLALGIAEQELYARIQRLVGTPVQSHRPDRWLPVMLIGLAAFLAAAQSPNLEAPLLPEFFAASSARQRIVLDLPAMMPREYRPITAPENEPVSKSSEPLPVDTANATPPASVGKIATTEKPPVKPGAVETASAPEPASFEAPVTNMVKTDANDETSTTGTTDAELPVTVTSGGELLHAEEPVYPRRALRYGEEGQVLLEFTITPQGEVTDASVVEASPRGLFEAAALQAISEWRYQPFVENGEPVARRVSQLMEFRIAAEPSRRTGTPGAGECKEQTGTRLCRAPHSEGTELRVLKN